MCDIHDLPQVEELDPTPSLLDRPLGRRGLIAAGGASILGLGLVGANALPAVAAERSQNGWTTKPALARIHVHGRYLFPPGVRKGDVHTILQWVATRFNDDVEPLRDGWNWGYSYRKVRGGASISNHGSGTAIDCNAPNHPLGKSGTFSAAQRRNIDAIVRHCDGVVRWGGNYSGRKDEMHFEINVPQGDARVGRLVRKLGGSPTPPPPPPPGGGGAYPRIKKGSKGAAVTEAQFLLVSRRRSVATDGVFGPKTHAATVAFQRANKLVADGIIGPKTWAKLISTVKRGNKGAAVKAAQHALGHRGFGTAVDGIFGSGTHAKVVAFQRSKKLAGDGVVGPRTWAALI
ncbi:peptidoglycan-binding protein [Propionibacteriaceae bacterium Y1685]